MSRKRTLLLVGYMASMIGLSLLNVVFNVIPIRISDNDLNLIYSLLSQILCMGIIPLIFALVARRNGKQRFSSLSRNLLADYRYTTPLPKKCWLLLIPLCISFYFVTQLVARIGALLLLILQYNYPISSQVIYGDAGDLIKWIAVTALLPAIFEEFTHRGILLDAFSEESEVKQVLLSGLLFSLMHTNVLQSVYAFVGGCIFAYIVIRSRSIYPAMIMHFCNNAIACMSEYGSQYPNKAFGWMAEFEDIVTSNYVSSLVYIAILIGNAFLFFWLVKVFVDCCPKTEMRKPRYIIKNYLPIDTVGTRNITLKENAVLIGVIVMCGFLTFATYIWGVLR